MAIKENKNQQLAWNTVDVNGEGFFYGVYGSTFSFDNMRYSSNPYSYITGTYAPSNTVTNAAGSLAYAPTEKQLQDTRNVLTDPMGVSLSEIASAGSLTSAKNNSFFSEFFNYYLGLAQERQANLSKNIGRANLLSGSASNVGGSLL